MLALLTASACADDKGAPTDEDCTLEAAPAAVPVGGDGNGDGLLDVSDAIYLLRHELNGGPDPSCEAAIDVPPYGRLDATEGLAPLYYLGSGSYALLDAVDATSCARVERAVAPPCGDGLRLDLSAPETVRGAAGETTSFEATVTLTSPSLAVEAWSFTLSAEGCALSDATTAGTRAADTMDDPPGLRDGGYAWQALASPEEGAVITALSWRTTDALPADADAQAIHRFTVSGTPTAGCATCTLRLVDDARVASVASAGGYRYAPALGSATVQLCAD